MRISDWSLDVCSSDLSESARPGGGPPCPCRGCDRRSFLHAPGLDFTDDRARQARLVGRDELVAHRVADGVEEAAAAMGVLPALEMEPPRIAADVGVVLPIPGGDPGRVGGPRGLGFAAIDEPYSRPPRVAL